MDESEEDCAFSASRKRVWLAAVAAALASVLAAEPTFSAFKRKCSAARGGAPEEDEAVVLLPRRARTEGAEAVADADAADAAVSKSANAAAAADEEDGDADRDTGAEPAPPASEPCACVCCW